MRIKRMNLSTEQRRPSPPAGLDVAAFLLVSVGSLGVVPLLALSPWWVLPLQGVLSAALLWRQPHLGASAVFFCVLGFVHSLGLFPPVWWSASTLIAIVAYVPLARRLSDRGDWLDWLAAGAFDIATGCWVAAISLGSTIALCLWVWSARPDLHVLFAQVPQASAAVISLGVLAFALLNAAVEEGIFRGIFWTSLTRSEVPVPLVLSAQAAFFGLCHYRGFPSGLWGMGLASMFGFALGLLRLRSRGLLAAFTAHVCADITIAGIVLSLSGRDWS
jgi:membrane protease YdiL (CAAX protease family)